MFKSGTIENVRMGKISGIVCAVLFLPGFLIAIPIVLYPDNITFRTIAFALYIGIFISYVLFLMGILAIVKERADKVFVKDIKAFILLSIVAGLLVSVTGSFDNLISPNLLLALDIFNIILIMGVGIVAIRLGKDFKRLENSFGKIATDAAKWHRISGWLMATIILFIVGVFISLIADIYMWLILKRHLQKSS